MYSYIDKPKSLLGDKAFSHYRYVRRTHGFPKKNRLDHRYQYASIAGEIWKTVSKKLLTNTSGVYMDGIGYFVNWMTPAKIKMTKWMDGEKVEFHNHQTDGHFYPTGLFYISKFTKLNGWDLERGLYAKFKNEKWRLLKSGHFYKLNYKEMKKLFYNEKYNY